MATGFIGIGIMGEGMAGCLLKAGKSLVVWNRDATKAQKLSKAYPGLVTVVASAGEVIDACGVTYSMLSTLEASEAVFPSILKSMKQGKSLVDCATLTPERMQTMAQAVEIAQGRFLEAPVSGSKAPAAQGALIFLCGGDKSLYDECKPDLQKHSDRSIHPFPCKLLHHCLHARILWQCLPRFQEGVRHDQWASPLSIWIQLLHFTRLDQ